MSDFTDKYRSYISGLTEKEFIDEMFALISLNEHVSDEVFEIIENALDDANSEIWRNECKLKS